MALQRRSRTQAAARARERGVLAAVVVARRQELALSQVELAELAGVSTRFVHVLENGGVTVGLDRLLAILETLGLHLQVERGERDRVVAGPVLGQHLGLADQPPTSYGSGDDD